MQRSPETGRDERAFRGQGEVRHGDRHDGQERDATDERECFSVAAHEPPLAAGAEDGREDFVQRAVYRAGRQEGPEDPDTQRDRAAVDELARDPRLLRRRGRIDVADELDELLLRPLRAVDESEDADDQREERDGRKEQLERDRAGEE